MVSHGWRTTIPSASRSYIRISCPTWMEKENSQSPKSYIRSSYSLDLDTQKILQLSHILYSSRNFLSVLQVIVLILDSLGHNSNIRTGSWLGHNSNIRTGQPSFQPFNSERQSFEEYLKHQGNHVTHGTRFVFIFVLPVMFIIFVYSCCYQCCFSLFIIYIYIYIICNIYIIWITILRQTQHKEEQRNNYEFWKKKLFCLFCDGDLNSYLLEILSKEAWVLSGTCL